MPRPNDSSPLRKVVEQTIMWTILAATVGAAAMVDVRLKRLGEPVRVGGVELRLPAGWDQAEGSEIDGIGLSEDSDSPFAREIFVRTDPGSPFSLEKIFRPSRVNPLTTETFELPGGRKAKIEVVRTPSGQRGVYELEVTTTLAPPGSAPVVISIAQYTLGGRKDVDTNLKLMRRILETVQFVE